MMKWNDEMNKMSEQGRCRHGSSVVSGIMYHDRRSMSGIRTVATNSRQYVVRVSGESGNRRYDFMIPLIRVYYLESK